MWTLNHARDFRRARRRRDPNRRMLAEPFSACPPKFPEDGAAGPRATPEMSPTDYLSQNHDGNVHRCRCWNGPAQRESRLITPDGLFSSLASPRRIGSSVPCPAGQMFRLFGGSRCAKDPAFLLNAHLNLLRVQAVGCVEHTAERLLRTSRIAGLQL